MKIRTLVLLLLLPLYCFAQQADSSRARTRIEEFQSRNSDLIEKEYIEIFKTKFIQVQILKIKSLTKDQRIVNGVIIKWGATSMGYFMAKSTAYLDIDELDDLDKSIDVMLNKSKEPLPANYTELVFSTKSGFKISLFKSNDSWNVSLDDQYKYQAFQSISLEDLAKIKYALSAAKSKL